VDAVVAASDSELANHLSSGLIGVFPVCMPRATVLEQQLFGSIGMMQDGRKCLQTDVGHMRVHADDPGQAN
jgi:hypothetical protein